MANANRKGRTMSDQTLQHMLSTGEWIDIAPDYVDCYIQRCVDHGRLDSREAVLAALEAGREVRNDPADWYSYCRFKPKPVVAPSRPCPAPIMCDCGHAVSAAVVMQASMGTTCPDCYDRMSD